ncbi:MAG: geranylgeranyl reductase family protein [Chloroflexota bacterium]
MVHEVDVLIVGSGPSGTSTALHLVQQDPAWAGRMVVVDKAVHPREKLCGGGLTHIGYNVLSNLGLRFEPHSVKIKEIRLVYQDKQYSFYGDPVLNIVRRDEFDHWLVQQAEARGVEVRQGEGVTAITPHDDYVEVVTDKATFQAKVLVGADGSRSFVRQALKWDDESRVARLIEVLTPEDARTQPEFRDKVAVFDFTAMTDGLQGYYWDFPSFVQGQPFMNRGLFDSRARPERPKAKLKEELADFLAVRDRDLNDYKLKGHPIRWWDENGRFAIDRVILVGDAAGADPLFGEGISFALAYGEVGAAAISDAFARQEFSFATYQDQLLERYLFRHLNFRTKLARYAYTVKSPRYVRAGWQVARWLIKWTRWGSPGHNPTKPPSPVQQLMVNR